MIIISFLVILGLAKGCLLLDKLDHVKDTS